MATICDPCGKLFDYLVTFNKHYKQTHEGNGTKCLKREFQGPQCKKILNNLDFLRQHVPEECYCFVDALEHLKEIYKISHAKTTEK